MYIRFVPFVLRKKPFYSSKGVPKSKSKISYEDFRVKVYGKTSSREPQLRVIIIKLNEFINSTMKLKKCPIFQHRFMILVG